MRMFRKSITCLAGALACAIVHGAEVPSISGTGKEKFTPWEQVPVSASGRLPTGCPDFEVEPPRATGGPVVKAADFGFSTAREDNALALNRALAECRRVKASRLELAPGTYKCFGAEGVRMESLSDFTLDGKGAQLVFFRPREKTRPMQQWDNRFDHANLLITNCVRARVCGIVMDWAWERDPLASFGTVVDSHVDAADNASWIEYEMRERHPLYPEPVPMIVANAVADSLDRFVFKQGGFFSGNSEGHFGARNEWVSPTRLRVWPYVKMPGRMQNPAYDRLFTAAKNRAVVKSVKKGTTFRLQHFYYGEGGVVMHSNSHLSLEGVHVRACRGFGFQVAGTQHHWQQIDCSVAPPPGVKRPISSTADANHVVQSRGWCKFIRCRWGMQQDDMNNFHDRTTLAMKCGPRALEIVNVRGTSFFPLNVGEELELREDTFAPTGWRGRIVSVDGETCTMDRDVPQEKGVAFVVFNRSYGTDNIIFRDCAFTDAAARNLFHGSNVTIDNCSFTRTCGTPLRFLAVWTYRVWCEGTGCTNVVVRNCRFDANQVHHWKAKNLTSEILTCAFAPQDCDHWIPITNRRLRDRFDVLSGGKPYIVSNPWQDIVSDILVERCTFRNPRGLVWHMSDGRNLTFRDNTIVIDAPNEDGLSYRGSVLVENAEEVHFSGNRLETKVETPPAGLFRR